MICVYAPDCTDFSNNGLGTVSPQSCTVTETLNGEWELTLVHPIDELGKWQRLTEGCILRAPVPAAMTPQINLVTQQYQTTTYDVEIYKVSTSRDPLRLRSGTGTKYKILGKYKKGTEVIVIEKTSSSWYEVTCPDGKHGYMSSEYLTYVRTEQQSTTSHVGFTNDVMEARQLRDQPFRIYRVVPELNKVTIYARHIFYDLLDNMLKSVKPASDAVGASVVKNISDGCLSEHDFTFYSDLESTAADVSFENINPVEALLGDDGLAGKYGAELARDWFDVFLVSRVGSNSDVQIREKKNLTGISFDVDETDVVTRIMPTGQDADGNLLYLPELYIDSPNIGAYAHPKWIHLAVSEAKEVTEGDDTKSKSECYTDMRNAVQAEYDAGCDLPTVTLKVDFVNCKDTEEYKQYSALSDIFLGDSIRVIARRIGVEVTMRMTQYTYDCLTCKYTSVTLGTAAEALEGTTVAARQLASGSISGAKLMLNSIGSGHLQSGSVGSLQIKTAAIQSAHIKNASITQAHIAEALIETLNVNALNAVSARIQELAAGQITTDELYASIAMISTAQLTTANIINANIDWAQIESLAADIATISKAQITSANIDEANIDWAAITTLSAAVATMVKADIETADIDWSHIKDLATDTAIITQGTAGELYIAKLAVTEANMVSLTVGELVVKGSDGHFYSVSVNENGEVVTMLKQVSNDDVADLSINGGEKIIEGTITAGTLNVQNIFADNATIRSLIAANIDVDTLFAREATLNAINAMDITSNTYLKLMVESKAEQEDLESLEERVSAAELKITDDAIVSTVTQSETYTSDLSAVQEAADAAQSAVENLQIGGRNLLLDSQKESTFKSNAVMPDISEYGQALLAQAETTVVISFEAKADAATDVDHYPRTESGALTSYAQPTSITTEWQRYSHVYTYPAGAYVKYTIRSNSNVTGGGGSADIWVTIRNIKLEVGNKATDWTAAPEDVSDEISAAQAAADANAADITSLTSRVTTAEQKITADAIVSTVTSSEEYQADLAAAASSGGGIELVVGTQTATTGAWTGTVNFTELKDGQQIAYWLPYSGSGNATLELTFPDGTTTGAIPCYFNQQTRLGTQFVAGSVIRLTYRENAKYFSYTVTQGWWADANYNTDTYDRIRSGSVKIKSAFTYWRFVVGDADGYFLLEPGVPFDVGKPILWATSSGTAGYSTSNVYLAYSSIYVRYHLSTFTGVQGASLYLVGTLNGSTFTPAEGLFTCTQPTAEDGLTYMLIGTMTSAYYTSLFPEHPLFRYVDGVFQPLSQIAYEAYAEVGTVRTEMQTAIEQTNASIALKADQTTVDSLTSRMDTAESSITQNANNIALKVSTSTYNTEKVYRGTTAPTTLYTNMLWLDTSVSPNLLKRYTGSTWVAAGAQEVKSSGIYIGNNNVAITTENFLLQLLDPANNENVLMEMSADGNVGFKQLYADEVISDSVAQAYAGSQWMWVDPSITNPTSQDFRSLGEAVQTLNNRYLRHDVTIYLPWGVETYEPSGVVIQGLSGPGKLTIYGYSDSSILNSYIKVQGCFAQVSFQNLHLRESRTLNGSNRQAYLVEITKSHFVEFNGCTLDANSITYDSVYARSSHVFLNNCGLYNALQGLECYLAQGNMKNCCGSCNWSMISYASVIIASGTVPAGSRGGGENGQVFAGSVTIDYGTAIPTVTPDETGIMYASNTRSWRGSWRTDTYDVIQGVYSESGYYSSLNWHRGCMWFSNATNLLAGGTVKSATLTLHRKTGSGSSSAKTVYLCAISNTSASGTPSIAYNYGAIGTIGRDKQVTFSIPVDAVQGLADGWYGGLCLYESPYNFGSSTYSNAYMRMSGIDTSYEPYIECVFSGSTAVG